MIVDINTSSLIGKFVNVIILNIELIYFRIQSGSIIFGRWRRGIR